MNNQAPLLFRRGAFTLSEADRRQPVCHIRPGAAMSPPVRGFRIETHAFHAESAARAFFKTREDLNFDGILLNVTFEDNWKELYDGAKVEYGADGVMRCLLPDGRRYEHREHLLQLVDDPIRSGTADIDEIEPDQVPLAEKYGVYEEV